MKLHDPSFIDFDGTPITGRVPPQLWVAGGDLDAFQKGGVAHAYKLFCDAKRTMIGAYLVQHRKLADGTSIRMMSNNGLDVVLVLTSSEGGEPLFDDLFMAVPGYSNGIGYPPFDPKFSAQWGFNGATSAPTKLSPKRKIENEAGIKQHPGNLTWWNTAYKANKKPMILSWYGRATRYGRLDYYSRHWQHHLNTVVFPKVYGTHATSARTQWKSAFKANVWLNGVRHAVKTAADVDVPVMSAALKREGAVGEEVLNLYVVSYQSDDTLAVYKGPISPMTGRAVVVELAFAIPFKIDSTTYAAIDPNNPHWEALLQPLYFNASCTRLAGLVAVRRNSAVNPTAASGLNTITEAVQYPANGFYARLIEVDIVTQATTFSNADAQETIVDDVVSAGDGDNATTTITHTRKGYAAVDFVEDELVVVMAAHTYVLTTVMSGSSPSASTGTEWHNEARTIETSYRISKVAGDVTLASKATASTSIGEVYTTSTRTSMTSGSGSGHRRENISAALFTAASVEGGDLRNGVIHVAEFLEVGSSQLDLSIEPNAGYGTVDAYGNPVPWTSGWGPRIDGATSGEDPDFAPYMVITAVNIDQRRRKPAARISVWKDGAEIEVSGYWENEAVGMNSTHGPNATLQTLFPAGEFATWRAAAPTTRLITTTRAGADRLREFTPFSLDTYNDWNPWYATGRPYINVSATTPDGSYWFYNIGPFWAWSGSSQQLPHGTAFAPALSPLSAFYIDDVKAVADWSQVVTSGADPAVSSPVFLYQVPRSLP